MSQPRQPLQNVLWLVGERILRAVVTATVLGVVARHLEPAGFGRLNFAVAVAAIATALANLSLEGLVVNELIRRPSQAGAVLGTAFRMRLLAGACTAALVSTLANVFTPQDARLILVVSLGLMIQPLDVIDLWFQRHLESRRTAVARFVGLSAGATLKLWLVASNADLTAFAWAQVADAGFIGLALIWAGTSSSHSSGPWIWDSDIALTLWKKGAVLALATLAVSFAMRFDQLLVRQWLGEKEAGFYFASSRLVEFAAYTGATIALSLFPSLAASYARNPGEYEARLQGLYDALSALGWIFALGCSALGWLVVPILYGRAYVAAAPVLVVQGWACLIALNATARWQHILLAAPPVLNLGAALIHIMTVCGIGLWLIPNFGTVGAAGALVVANLTSGLMTSYLFPSLRSHASIQMRGLFIPFTPTRWGALLAQFHSPITDRPTP